jgi:heme o synthase
MQNVTSVRVSSLRASVNAYIGLMKPHVTVLLLGTTLAAMAVAGMPSLPVVLATLLGGALAAGSANALNCYWDRDIDQVMSRTRSRALPSHKVGEKQALVFGLSLGIASFLLLSLVVNLLAALLALSAILFYVGVYTMWLKRTTPQNIVIGGAAGAVPVLVGWAASTGRVGLPALCMFLIIFLWTPPHFWALSLVLRKDYERAGVPMLPVVRGDAETRKQIVIYMVTLLLGSLTLVAIGTLGWFYLAVALLSGGALLFAAMVIDHLWH